MVFLENENTDSCIALASIYDFGLAGKTDASKAISLYEEVIKAGDMRGYTNIGSIYYRNKKLQNKNKVLSYFKKGELVDVNVVLAKKYRSKTSIKKKQLLFGRYINSK